MKHAPSADPGPRRNGGRGWLVVLCAALLVAALPGGVRVQVNGAPESEINPSLTNSRELTKSPNLLPEAVSAGQSEAERFQKLMDEALGQKAAGQQEQAEKLLVKVLENGGPLELQAQALLELAVGAHQRKEFLKAQQIYAQFLKTFPHDPSVPEILLRQGLIYREMGAPVLALSKFYAVMSTALHLKSDRMDHYQRLVLQAQSEIAETFYCQGKYDDAVDFMSRLLKLDSPDLNRATIHYKLVRSLSLRGRQEETTAQALLYLDRYPESEHSPEVRFLCADAFRKLSRNQEAIEQLLLLLKSPHPNEGPAGEAWAYWQQRTGNELGNQLYSEGDFVSALDVYRALAAVNPHAEWQVPALYQVGLVYERLHQAAKAAETYDRILQVGGATNAPSPAVSEVLDMAKWRKQYLTWLERADAAALRIRPDAPTVIHE